ncbi:MAG: hypothetical protein M0T86_03455 [Betaproteobacteria bacterium]|nr:hypothetical protein [Betaproteobacteria bacterium]
MLANISDRLLCSALNHLLAQAPWARRKAMLLAGQSIRLNLFPLQWTLAFNAEGWIEPSTTEPLATLRITPFGAIRIAFDEAQAQHAVEILGDAQLAARFGMILRTLTWDAQADLARLLGDSAAHLITHTINEWMRRTNDTLLDQARAWMEYATEETPLLAGRARIAAFVADIDALRDRTARLEQRVSLLAQRLATERNC